jgi:hypothetical protein
MRRMLSRCNTAIKQTARGDFTSSPDLALELEYQLDTWYDCLPESIRFVRRWDNPTSLRATGTWTCPLATFLRVQYHCCKLAIFWPAVFQEVHYRESTPELLDHCGRFLESYIQVCPSLLSAFNDCIVNRWTLFLR